ncbi:MAG: hypothetical protein J3K34DRAFT_442196 [Monoraphidium minutum]|nr:MAG: hypothetical protein J3K34DRAFT_442196 [Monoraphidium minutum]
MPEQRAWPAAASANMRVHAHTHTCFPSCARPPTTQMPRQQAPPNAAKAPGAARGGRARRARQALAGAAVISQPTGPGIYMADGPRSCNGAAGTLWRKRGTKRAVRGLASAPTPPTGAQRAPKKHSLTLPCPWLARPGAIQHCFPVRGVYPILPRLKGAGAGGCPRPHAPGRAAPPSSVPGPHRQPAAPLPTRATPPP